MGPLRVGFVYGIVAAAIAVFSSFFFVVMDPASTPDWVLAATTDFLPLLSLAAYLLLGILAAVRSRPTHIEADVPYRSQVMRDAALAAVVVAVMIGAANILSTGLLATAFSGSVSRFASEAAPKISGYVNEEREGLSDPPPPSDAEQVEALLQPPGLRDLGQSLGNAAIGTVFLGVLGAGVGALRGGGSESHDPAGKPPDDPEQGSGRNGRT